MAKYKITHDRPGCIGCAACTSVCPAYWEMGADGKSSLKGSSAEGDKTGREIEEADFSCNKNAADSCPVNVIHLKNLESGEEII